ncbi:succinate-semialdehyde dehydrogenase/glutarate-semialdehyde dehydrogenase [Nitrosomonas nitrosa]|uniref:NAD-dependent succinate-semialdehyde dehydrogenase n=1 Tax=Nitrosomonas nitrosa TaxID=52442 RepID=UPI000D32344A|nr:NAD-dependent succinate-semialdehyde dehydrogenase [Nitrosomonas nitrosa]MCO6434216.1 NAD-dependent succinate-semialdehyde dehydrogenase [Nitrosomonas nitrosa]PTR04858.1 succinate-semialdehyde dehydrogenase/glutarate-semialdehyde dehydrogenase [Nitrosomonas nitrosa]HNP52629.1 NAD-dependent succinate-semialdehyde dehydrogenase [Nitrosomonas nitrosa]
MPILSINPVTGQILDSFPLWSDETIDSTLSRVVTAYAYWSALDIEQRAVYMHNLAQVLRQRRDDYAQLITEEMGKLLKEARAEIDKCALGCEHYAGHAKTYLAEEIIDSDASRSGVIYQPLGTLLCIMPWNFPFWQLIRAAVPAMMAGNTVVLKHASNVPRCALALEEAFREAGFPENAFRTLMISATQAEKVIADPRIAAVTLTGSSAAGRKVAAIAGQHLKKCVLELGGSDPFIVLEDADLEFTVSQAVSARFQNMGQSCIAAKRFILVEGIADLFLEHFKTLVSQLRMGDPKDESTTIAPMARVDLRDALHAQIERSLAMGAILVAGGETIGTQGAYYAPTILDRVYPGMPAFDEELFGPVAAIVRVRNTEEAIQLANQTPFGLGGSVWTRNIAHGEAITRRLLVGAAFVNGIVKSDPRLPFGGIKASGFGRELSYHGIREFVNIKTIWVG